MNIEITEYTFYDLDGRKAMTAERTKKNQDIWAIRNGFGDCLNRNGEWSHEPFPSERTEEFLSANRWKLDEALAIFNKELTTLKENRNKVLKERFGERALRAEETPVGPLCLGDDEAN